MTVNFTKGRVSILVLLMLFGMLLAGCGADATPTTAPAATATKAAATATTAAPAATATKAAPAATATTAMAVTPTEAMAGETPTTGASNVEPTPVSSWKPGAHAGTIAAPSKLVSAGTLTIGSDVSYPPQEYMDASGSPVGFDIDVAAEIASRLRGEPDAAISRWRDVVRMRACRHWILLHDRLPVRRRSSQCERHNQ